MKTYAEEPHKRYEILRQLAVIRMDARKDGVDLNDRTRRESKLENFTVAVFWMLVRLHKSKRDNLEF
jgi:hypothetical protein